MTLHWKNDPEGEYNEFYTEIESAGEKHRFSVYSDRDGKKWTLRSPADDIINLSGDNITDALGDAKTEIENWG